MDSGKRITKLSQIFPGMLVAVHRHEETEPEENKYLVIKPPYRKDGGWVVFEARLEGVENPVTLYCDTFGLLPNEEAFPNPPAILETVL